MIILSYFQAKELISARRQGRDMAATSLDLNLTRAEVALTPDGAEMPGERILTWNEIEEIAKNENTCFTVENGQVAKVQLFSDRLNRFYSLKPTGRAPTLLISGIPMHRILGIDPHEDTLRKIATLAPIHGRVLDTTTGLGYTAIEAAKAAASVLTIELDPAVLEIGRRNPWSAPLFANPKIEQRTGNSAEIVPTLPAGSFDFIFHDPPTVSLGGELYSESFYKDLFRVIRRGGRLFHYVGNLESNAGATVAKGAVRRLRDVGFTQVEPRKEAFGLTARKP